MIHARCSKQQSRCNSNKFVISAEWKDRQWLKKWLF